MMITGARYERISSKSSSSIPAYANRRLPKATCAGPTHIQKVARRQADAPPRRVTHGLFEPFGRIIQPGHGLARPQSLPPAPDATGLDIQTAGRGRTGLPRGRNRRSAPAQLVPPATEIVLFPGNQQLA